MKNFIKYGNYSRKNLFNKLGVEFEAGRKLLDLGCGDGADADIFIREFGLDVHGVDLYTDSNIKNIDTLKFVEGSIFSIPFANESFDYVFLHNVLHHIDEDNQAFLKHIDALKELKRVVKSNGYIVIVEANRYNPLSFPHMVKMRGHNHWKQSYFKKTISAEFGDAEFKHIESHVYPLTLSSLGKVYESFMEKLSPKRFLAYNVAIIQKTV